jgi:predicted O-methyltransferase YrrM
MNPLHEKILSLVPTLHGWCDVPKAITLCNLVLAMRPRVIVEVGVWGGRSLLPMVMAAKHGGLSCRVIGIDPWSIAASVAGQTMDADRKWWSEINHELVYQHFLHQCRELDLLNDCEIIREKSEQVEPPASIDLFHCDGNHGPDALRDTQRFAANIAQGGICVLDDIGWSGGFVAQSADWLLANGFIQLHPLGTGAVYMRTK